MYKKRKKTFNKHYSNNTNLMNYQTLVDLIFELYFSQKISDKNIYCKSISTNDQSTINR